jgi:hypothetical protein
MHVHGRVIDRETHRGLSGLRVEAWTRDSPAPIGRSTTDTRGRFRITVDDATVEDHDPAQDFVVRVLDGGGLLTSTEDAVGWHVRPGEIETTIEIEGADGVPAVDEVGLHELGESIAVAATSVQRELARYPNPLGAFVVDDLSIDLPVRLRVDTLGQVLATVVEGEAPGAARMQFRIRPVVGATQPPPAYPAQPLSALRVLPGAAIARLEVHRIFSVDDLLRVARNAAGRAALERLELGVPIDDLAGRAAVLALPMLPPRVAEKLIELGVTSPAEFVGTAPRKLSGPLTKQLGERIKLADVARWQEEVRELITLVPSQQHAVPGEKRGGSDD